MMIQQDNFQMLLRTLGFTEQGQLFTKQFAHVDCELQVDFEQKKLIFPESKGLRVNERQTCNFASSENAVVFECVHRLLEKGYKPEHIELEPKWKLGHGASGGRADILVRDYQGVPLLIIECKTYGKEFEKAWKNTQEDGAQLFSYIEQEKATQFVCLYASHFNTDTQQIDLSQKIISVKDNPTILLDNPKLASFAAANNSKERFRVWKETYQLEATETGLFEENIQPYQIGKDKYTLLQDTKIIGAMDIKGAYHRFRTILRKHNVSRRENAFEVLVNLFLCKIVDELEHPEDLKFYWKGIAYDNYFDLVDRLQLLYKTGMERFLNQDIVYVSNEHIDQAFWAIKQKPNATEIRVKELFRELKFYKGLDFEFIKVFNKAYFNKNAKILLEIIQMWQGLRLTGSEQNQFLGDMFEYFLDNGIKQTEGQFFTPVPICKFIVSALPLEQLIENHSEPIQAIDYACGSGHFLTEYAQQIPELVQQIKQIDDPSRYYQGVYGIEKEDRLAKVAKVSAFMYGRKEVNIIDADALVPHTEIREAGFQVLIANPPFAVEDFLLTIDEEARARYTLMDKINDDGNRNIQCFFLERAKQLLAGDGVMGVIVPSSVLSNSDAVHIATREILLQYFDFVAITELGNGTFGKTGTNTVVLFLRRKANRPEPAEHYRYRINNFFEDWATEVVGGGAYLDVAVVEQYCAHVGLSYQDYQSVLLGDANNNLLQTEIFQEYRAAFDAESEIKKLKVHKLFKKKTEIEQHIELQKRFNVYVRAIEQDKLYYFMLAVNNPCPVLLVKSPVDKKEQKQFLGYGWSDAKGNEGVIYNGGDTVYEIQTPMFDPKDRNNESKISYLIRQNFFSSSVSVPESLQLFVSNINLTGLLDFKRKTFDKAFSLAMKKESSINTQYPTVVLGTVADVLIGGTPSRAISKYFEGSNLWVSISEMNGDFITDTKEKITDEGVTKSNVKLLPKGTTLLSFKLSIGKTAIAGADLYTNEAIAGLVPKESKEVLDGYLFNLFSAKLIDLSAGNNAIGQSLNSAYLREQVKIPLPPMTIQQKIVDECRAVDEVVSKYKQKIEEAATEINFLVQGVSAPLKKLLEVTSKIGSGATPRGGESSYKESGITLIRSQNIYDYGFKEKGLAYIDEEQAKALDNVTVREGDVLFNITGASVARCCVVEHKYLPARVNQHVAIIRPTKQILSSYLHHILISPLVKKELLEVASGSSTREAITKQQLESFKIPVPPLADQAALVAQIEAIEAKIAEAQALIDAAPTQKQTILKKYL